MEINIDQSSPNYCCTTTTSIPYQWKLYTARPDKAIDHFKFSKMCDSNCLISYSMTHVATRYY